jgi:hypothetical protein
MPAAAVGGPPDPQLPLPQLPHPQFPPPQLPHPQFPHPQLPHPEFPPPQFPPQFPPPQFPHPAFPHPQFPHPESPQPQFPQQPCLQQQQQQGQHESQASALPEVDLNLAQNCWSRGKRAPVQFFSEQAHPPVPRSNSPSPMTIHDPLLTFRTMAIPSGKARRAL